MVNYALFMVGSLDIHIDTRATPPSHCTTYYTVALVPEESGFVLRYTLE